MSEKRIYCIEVSGECKYLLNVNRPALAHLCESTPGLYCTKNFSWKPITKDACKNCKEGKYQGFTRKQVIHKIAKALCRADSSLTSCEDCIYCRTENCQTSLENWFLDDAEVALNALLEGHDDEQ